MYFHRWKGLLARETAADNNIPVTTAPSPDNKIQGLVVLLYGHGGFGKSTLLRHYRDFVLKENDAQLSGVVHASSVIDWENVPESRRSLFTFSSDRAIDASVYYRMLCAQLASAIGKEVDTFKRFQRAMRAVEEAHRQASQIIESTRGDDRFASLRGLASEGIVALLRLIPPVGSFLNNQQIAGAVKGVVGAGVSIASDEVTRLHAKMREKLGARLDDYLEPDVKLGQSIGHDLREFARNHLLLLFFDTYEVVDEGDRLLRIVMGAAGQRVGWVIAGRDNLWTGLDQRLRSRGIEYGYKELVLPDRAKEFDFNVGGIGTFTPSDLKEYFDEVCRRIPYQPPLAHITTNEAQAIWDVTRGIPLAVKIAAVIYLKTGRVADISASEQGQRDIVDQMVRRYLLHVRDTEQDRDKLYGLAMLRRANQPHAITAVLDLQPEQAQIDYPGELARLHRRYSFIYTEKEEPALHQEVRHYLRLWLLEHRAQPGIRNINERLRKAHHQALQELEERRPFNTLKDRLQDDEWIGIYLDLAEQLFWLDPVEGVRSLLPFMLAAAIYRRDANKEAVETGTIFTSIITSPYRAWWTWASQSLANTSSQNPSPEALRGLEELEKLLKQQRPIFTPPLSAYRNELEAALWWRLGEAYAGKDDHKALEWYEKALARLGEEEELREAAASICWNIAYQLNEQKKSAECLSFWNRAIELKPDYTYAYNNRGTAYGNLKQYEQAISDFTQAITLDPNLATAYTNRGTVYDDLKQYEQASATIPRLSPLTPTMPTTTGATLNRAGHQRLYPGYRP